MPKLPLIRVRALIRALEKLGFLNHHQVGSHAQYKHPDGRRTTIPVHYGRDIKKKMLRGIISDLKMTTEEFIASLKR